MASHRRKSAIALTFDNLTPLYPDRKIKLELDDPTKESQYTACDRIDITFRDLVSVLLLVAPPRTGKTVMLQNIATSIAENHPDAYLAGTAD